MSFEDEIWDQVCRGLHEGVSSAKHEFHSFCIANMGDLYPEGRTVILRDFEPEKRSVIFHTDARSPKYQQLSANPRVVSIFYGRIMKMQLRFKAIAILHRLNNLAEQRWKKTSKKCKLTYLKTYPPGRVIEHDSQVLDLRLINSALSDSNDLYGFENFTVIELLFDSMEILLLNSRGNKCVKLQWDEDNKRSFCYLAP
jgi:pyridoxamine 5'-phosphate oxidase